jgi:hypothetical protein
MWDQRRNNHGVAHMTCKHEKGIHNRRGIRRQRKMLKRVGARERALCGLGGDAKGVKGAGLASREECRARQNSVWLKSRNVLAGGRVWQALGHTRHDRVMTASIVQRNTQETKSAADSRHYRDPSLSCECSFPAPTVGVAAWKANSIFFVAKRLDSSVSFYCGLHISCSPPIF